MEPLPDEPWLRSLLSLTSTLATADPDRDLLDLSLFIDEFLDTKVAAGTSCLFHDDEAEMLWSGMDETFEVPTTRGLVGAAVRNGRSLIKLHSRHEPCYVPELDGPGESLAIQLVQLPGHKVRAILVAVPPTKDLLQIAARLQQLAHHLAPIFEGWALQVEYALADEPETKESPYRAEALAHRFTYQTHGPPVRLWSPWVARASWALIALGGIAIAYLSLAPVGHYATGVGVVRLGGRTEYVAREGGAVAHLSVQPGQSVQADQELLRLHDAESSADLQRLSIEYENELRRLLTNPADTTAQANVRRLSAELTLARRRVQERTIRADQPGIVLDVRVAPGRLVKAGQILVSTTGQTPEPHLLAILPGNERPRLQTGMPITLRLEGFARAEVTITLDDASADVFGIDEAIRTIGPEVAQDLASFEGPVTLIRANLPPHFHSKGHSLPFYDGMHGQVLVRIRETSILEALLP